jgi:MOSC domain-containing protein YiiM
VSGGRVLAISVSDRKGEQKTNVEAATFVTAHGIEGDAHAGDWHRQVSLLMAESIDKIVKLGLDVHPGDFAENVTLSGFDLLSLSVGDEIRLGPVLLRITQIGKQCHSRCKIYEKAGDCVMPREGLFAEVLAGGVVRVGDPVGYSVGRQPSREEK